MGINNFENASVHDLRPYHAPFLSDDEAEDDDVCVWRDGPILPDFDSDDETPVVHDQKWTLTPDTNINYKARRNVEKMESSNPSLKMRKPEKPEKIETLRPLSQATIKTAIAVRPEKAKRVGWTEQGDWAKVGRIEKFENAEVLIPHSKTSFKTRIAQQAEDSEVSVKTRSKARSSERTEILRSIPKTSSRPSPKTSESHNKYPEPARPSKEMKSPVTVQNTPKSAINPKTGLLTKEALREREIQYAFSATRRNLTHISQFMLKLEARAGKTTKEGIRNTLDATVNDRNYDLNAVPDYWAEIEQLKHMSDNIFTRLFLIDRYWRRVARKARDEEEGKSPEITLLPEPAIKDWVLVELRTNHLAAEDVCFYTGIDLANGRPFGEWVKYLRELCGFGNHPFDEGKLVDLAWLFLDRNLRGPRPLNPTTADQFVAELEAKKRSGLWAKVLANPKKQEEDDVEAWQTLQRYWSSRTAPL